MSGLVSASFSYTILLVASGILQAQNYLSLTGTVEDSTEAPIAAASVSLISQERVQQTKSEANGYFPFSQVTTGRYEVQIAAPGFAKQTISLDLKAHTRPPPLSIALRAGKQPDEELCGSHASVTYGPLGESNSLLSGTVHDYVHGAPLRNVELSLWKVGDSKASFESHSGDSGRFRFENLPPGPYDLRVAKAGYLPLNIKQLLKPHLNGMTIHATLLQQNTMIACQ